eukprot:498471-Hanusia_phi.AAC.1
MGGIIGWSRAGHGHSREGWEASDHRMGLGRDGGDGSGVSSGFESKLTKGLKTLLRGVFKS